MKIGADQKNKVYALVVLVVIAGGLLARNFSAPDGAAPAAPPAVTAPAAAIAATPSRVASAPSPLAQAKPGVSLDPTLHLDQLQALRAITYAGGGRDLFHFGATPPPPLPAYTGHGGPAGAGRPGAMPGGAPVPRMPPLPPPRAALPLKFYGFAAASGLPKQIFVQIGADNNYVVTEGDVIEKRYLIEKINKASVLVKDTVTQDEQELPLQQG